MARIPSPHLFPTPVAAAAALLALASHAGAQQPAAETQQLPSVVVTGQRDLGYQTRSIQIGGPGGTQDASPLDIPASTLVFTRDILQDTQAAVLSEVVRIDASIGEFYAPVGYYENFSVRGFPLSFDTSYRMNGMPLTGEQVFALENKEHVEVLKGIGALQAGATTPGGLINFVTKRPAEVRSLTLGINDSGGRLLAADIGSRFGTQKEFGLRVNAATEALRTPIPGTDGERHFVGGAFDWRITPQTLLTADLEHQQRRQRSVPGLQVLEGNALPPVMPKLNLSRYDWVRPVSVDSTNMTARLEHRFSDALQGFAEASHSRARLDDHLAYPYGCSSSPSGWIGSFCSDGSFDVYDFRSIGEVRESRQLQAGVNGNGRLAGMAHRWTLGATQFRREVRRGDWDFFAAYAGSDNLFSPGSGGAVSAAGLPVTAVYKVLDHRQDSLFVKDAVELTPQATLHLGGRWLDIRQKGYADTTGAQTSAISETRFLPSLGAIYRLTPQLAAYGSYAKGYEIGTVPSQDFANADQPLPGRSTRQIEAGLKYEPSPQIGLSAAVFRAKRPNEFSRPNGTLTPDLVQEGEAVHTGAEATLFGRVSPTLNLTASLSVLRAVQRGTFDPIQNGSQVVGIPKFKSSVFAEYTLPAMPEVSLLAGWSHVGRKPVTVDNSVSVGSYDRLDAGLLWQTRLGGQKATLRFNVDNLLGTRYWRDVSQTYGSNLLYPSLPRTWRLSLQADF